MTEPLYACPRCERRGFTWTGLSAHVCRGSNTTDERRRLTPHEQTLAQPLSIQITDTGSLSIMPNSAPTLSVSSTSTALVPATRVDLEKLDSSQIRISCEFEPNTLAQRAKAMLDNIDGLQKERAMKAILAGLYLHEIKISLGHGEFGAWKTKHFGSNRSRVVNNYMALAAKFCRASKLLLPELISANQFTLDLVTTDETGATAKAKLEKFVGGRGLTDLLHKHGVLGQRGGAQKKKARDAGDDDAPEEQAAPDWCTEPEKEIWEKLETDEQRAAFCDWRPRIRCMAEQVQNPPQSALVHLDEASRNDLVATAEQLLHFLAPGLLRRA